MLFSDLRSGRTIPLVLQQHDGFARRLQGQLAMLGAVVDAVRNARVLDLCRRIEQAQLETRREQAPQRLVEVRFLEQARFDRRQQVAVLHAAIQVGAGLDCRCHARRRIGRRFVIEINIADGAAVRNHVALKAPLLAQDVVQQARVGAGGQPVHAVVGAHYALRAALSNRGFEMRQVGLEQVALADARVEGVAQGFGPAVHRVMFGGGDGLQILRIVALQAVDEVHGHLARQVGILAVGFHAASPPRIAEQVDVGSPEGQALVDIALAAADEFVILGAGLVADRGGHPQGQVRIPGGGQADRLRKNRGASGARHPVQALVPPVVGRNSEPLDGRRIVHELGDFFLQRHAGDQIVHAAFGSLREAAGNQHEGRQEELAHVSFASRLYPYRVGECKPATGELMLRARLCHNRQI